MIAWDVADPGPGTASPIDAAEVAGQLRLSSDQLADFCDTITPIIPSVVQECEVRSGLILAPRTITASVTRPVAATGNAWLPSAPCEIPLPVAPVRSVTVTAPDGFTVETAEVRTPAAHEPAPANPRIRVTAWPDEVPALTLTLAAGWTNGRDIPPLVRTWLLMRATDRFMHAGTITSGGGQVSRTHEDARLLRTFRRW